MNAFKGNENGKTQSFSFYYSGFWKDDDEDRGLKKSEEVTLEGPFGQKSSKNVEQPKEEAKSIFSETSGQFSLLNTFGKVNSEEVAEFSLLKSFGKNNQRESAEHHESESKPSLDTFALKLKEKAVIDSSSGVKETFFFLNNDSRFDECRQFLKPKSSLENLRENYEQKRPLLASIMKKKMKNRAKKQEKMSFGSGKKIRKFNPNFNKKKVKR